MPLTDKAIRAAKPGPKTQRLADGGGMYLELAPRGGMYWRLKYRHRGKEKRLALGVFPDVSLKRAREKREEARRLLAEGIDPSAYRKSLAAEQQERATNSFEAVAREWFLKHRHTWTAEHATRIIRRLESNIFPWLGRRPIAEINAPEVLTVVRRIEARGAVDTAHRALQCCGHVFRYAVATGRAERDPSGDLRGALPPVRSTRFATMTGPGKIGGLLRAIDGYEGSHVVRCALRLAPLLFVRPGELRRAEWPEFDLEQGQWRIPAHKMKMRDTHIVPLSKQAVAILSELHPLTGSRQYVFPGVRTPTRPMSENTVNAALRRLGYEKTEMTGHGFRAMASTILHEQGWPTDAIERQLAHAERNKIKAAYNHAQYLPERRRMMQAWADYLDGLAAGADVVPIMQARQ